MTIQNNLPLKGGAVGGNMPNRTTLTEAEAAFVQAQRVARLATADADGHPHIVPVCYAFDGTQFYTPLDEKPKRVNESKLRRVRNIEARHEASLLIDQYDDDWSRLGYVLVHGRAELLQPGSPLHPQVLALLRTRYFQYRTMDLERHPVIMITPDSVTSWGPAIAGSP
jgi:PPOX class probable F420-dependent enzyme